MENKIFQPIEIVAKDEGNQQLYDIGEYLGWGSKVTINLSVRGSNLEEVAVYATKAIDSMREAQKKRSSEERAKEEALGELMAHDMVEELIELGRQAKQRIESVEMPTNMQEEATDGR